MGVLYSHNELASLLTLSFPSRTPGGSRILPSGAHARIPAGGDFGGTGLGRPISDKHLFHWASFTARRPSSAGSSPPLDLLCFSFCLRMYLVTGVFGRRPSPASSSCWREPSFGIGTTSALFCVPGVGIGGGSALLGCRHGDPGAQNRADRPSDFALVGTGEKRPRGRPSHPYLSPATQRPVRVWGERLGSGACPARMGRLSLRFGLYHELSL